eukprot:5181044-Pleurochrysis_carterae.AAC.1
MSSLQIVSGVSRGCSSEGLPPFPPLFPPRGEERRIADTPREINQGDSGWGAGQERFIAELPIRMLLQVLFELSNGPRSSHLSQLTSFRAPSLVPKWFSPCCCIPFESF